MDFFLENSGTWKVLENHFCPGKSLKSMLKVLESLEKYRGKSWIILPSGSNGTQAEIVCVDYMAN